jgi:hypothetical protein
MNKMTTVAALIAGFTLAGSSTASAQAPSPSSVFVDVNGGAQTQTQTLNTSTSFPLYGETAIINAAQAIDGGGLFDFGAGYRITRAFGIGVGFSFFSKTGEGNLAASIPDPLVLNRPRAVTASATGLKHREIGTHVMAVWFLPIDDKLDVTLFAGPSFIRLTQDVISGSVPAGTQTLNTANQTEKANATGANVGASVNYMFAPQYGIGIFLRYAGASTDLPSATDVKVGGFQVGGGLRLRF